MIRRGRLITRAVFCTIVLSAPVAAQEGGTTSLSALHDIIEPFPVAWWPPAPGWYVIGLIVVVSLLGGLLAWRRRVVANQYRGAALTELDAMRTAPGEANQLSALLKRVALVAWPRSKVAGMTGPSWWQFVDADTGGEDFSNRHGGILEQLAYRGSDGDVPDEEDVAASTDAIEAWIKQHHGAGER